MDVSKLSLLSWALIANTTLRSSQMMPSGPLRLALLPRHALTIPILSNIRFTDTVRIVSHGNLILKSCATSSKSQFLLQSQGSLTLVDYVHKSGSIVCDNQRLLVQNGTFNLRNGEAIAVSNCDRAKFDSCKFTSTSTSPIISLTNTKLAVVTGCNFSSVKNGCVVARNSSLEVDFTKFEDAHAARGAAIDFDGKYLVMEHVGAQRCSADVAGGAIAIKSGVVRMNDVRFANNSAPVGASIATDVEFTMFNSYFAGPLKTEVSGTWEGGQNRFSLKNVMVAATRPPTATRSLWPTVTPMRTVPVAATGVSYSQADYFTPILIVSVAFVVIVLIIAITAIIYNKIKKRGNTIYAGESETRDENEMGTVEVKSRYMLSDVYSLP